MNQQDSEQDDAEVVILTQNERPKEGIIVLSGSDVQSLDSIRYRFMLFDAYMDQFRRDVLNYVPFLNKYKITEEALLKFCVRLEKNTMFFASTVNQLAEKLELSGYNLPKKDELMLLIASFHQDHYRLTLFFQTVEGFFSPEAQQSIHAQFSEKEDVWDNVNNVKYSMPQMCQILQNSRIEYIQIRKKIQIFIAIFVRLFNVFELERQYIMVQIINAVKDIRCEAMNLEKYLVVISKVATLLKESSQSRPKDKEKPQKTVQKKYATSPSKREQEKGRKAKQVVHENVKPQQSVMKPLYSTIKQKAYGVIQTFFCGPALFKGQEQQPQQSQRLLKDQ